MWHLDLSLKVGRDKALIPTPQEPIAMVRELDDLIDDIAYGFDEKERAKLEAGARRQERKIQFADEFSEWKRAVLFPFLERVAGRLSEKSEFLDATVSGNKAESVGVSLQVATKGQASRAARWSISFNGDYNEQRVNILYYYPRLGPAPDTQRLKLQKLDAIFLDQMVVDFLRQVSSRI